VDSAAERVHAILRRSILTGKLRSGDGLSERAVSAELHIGRTPVREALLRLKHEGFIEVHPRLGNVVRLWTAEDVRARYDMRIAVESVAIRWAAQRMTPVVSQHLLAICDEEIAAAKQGDFDLCFEKDAEFHEALMRATGNDEICRVAQALGIRDAIIAEEQAPSRKCARRTVDEHRKIAQLTSEGRSDEAIAVLTTHIEAGARSVMSFFEKLRLSGSSLRNRAASRVRGR